MPAAHPERSEKEPIYDPKEWILKQLVDESWFLKKQRTNLRSKRVDTETAQGVDSAGFDEWEPIYDPKEWILKR